MHLSADDEPGAGAGPQQPADSGARRPWWSKLKRLRLRRGGRGRPTGRRRADALGEPLATPGATPLPGAGGPAQRPGLTITLPQPRRPSGSEPTTPLDQLGAGSILDGSLFERHRALEAPAARWRRASGASQNSEWYFGDSDAQSVSSGSSGIGARAASFPRCRRVGHDDEPQRVFETTLQAVARNARDAIAVLAGSNLLRPGVGALQTPPHTRATTPDSAPATVHFVSRVRQPVRPVTNVIYTRSGRKLTLTRQSSPVSLQADEVLS